MYREVVLPEGVEVLPLVALFMHLLLQFTELPSQFTVTQLTALASSAALVAVGAGVEMEDQMVEDWSLTST